MLVLQRQKFEDICIGEDITVTVVAIKGNKVRLGVDAPKSVAVHRREVFEAIKRQQAAPATGASDVLSDV